MLDLNHWSDQFFYYSQIPSWSTIATHRAGTPLFSKSHRGTSIKTNKYSRLIPSWYTQKLYPIPWIKHHTTYIISNINYPILGYRDLFCDFIIKVLKLFLCKMYFCFSRDKIEKQKNWFTTNHDALNSKNDPIHSSFIHFNRVTKNLDHTQKHPTDWRKWSHPMTDDSKIYSAHWSGNCISQHCSETYMYVWYAWKDTICQYKDVLVLAFMVAQGMCSPR